jgi:hypothetical protein
MDSKQELLERVLLMMKYDSSRTLNENVQIINEQSDANWKTKYACVPKHYGATKVTLKDGSTAYKINGLYYYNNGRAQPSRTYSCNDAFFKYPKNQIDGDAFRKWFYKNYSNDKYLGNVAKKYKVSQTGPYNSPELRKAWESYGWEFVEGGGKLTPDEVIAKRKEIENSDIDGYMRKVWGTSFSMPNAKSKQEWINGYAKYAAKEIEGAIFMVWGTNPDGKCSRKDKSFLDDKPIGLKWPSLWERLNEKGSYNDGGSTVIEYNTCYNEDVAMGLKDAYKPSWDHVVKAYGINTTVSVEKIVDKLWKTYTDGHGSISNVPSYSNRRIYRNTGSVSKSGGITMEEFHEIMMWLEIGSAFIPGIGPILSLGFGLTDALFYTDENPEMGGFILLLTLLPELKLFTNTVKLGKATGVYATTLNKLAKGDVKALTKQEIGFVNEIKTLVEANKGEVKADMKKVVGKEADKILNNPSSKKQLTAEEIKALNTVSAAKNMEFLKLDVLFGLAVPFTTKYGREALKRIFHLYEENIGQMTEAQWNDLYIKVNEIPPELMNPTLSSFENKPEEFVAYVKSPKVAKAINNRIKSIKTKVPTEELKFQTDSEAIARQMADEPNEPTD